MMVEYNRVQLGREAKKHGFVRDTFEKALRLKEILKFFNEHEYLSEHLFLKGDTAINMTIFNLPRLSVDIDMDYVPNGTRDEMLSAREQIASVIKEYMDAEGYQLSPVSRFRFSLDVFLFQYQNSAGNKDNIKIELNYSLRTHLFKPVSRPVLTDVFDDDFLVNTVAPMEIFAAKTNVLLSRAAARDLYDFNNMISFGLFDESENDLFRKSIIFYNTISQETVNKFFDTSAIDGLKFPKIKRDLLPVLRNKDFLDLEMMKSKAKEYIAGLMRVTDREMQYMESFEQKEYRPELLFSEEDILENIKEHPMALWKCRWGELSMEKHILIVDDDEDLSFIIVEMLEGHGFSVTSAQTLEDAFALLAKNKFHLILLDINLPDGTGFELCGELRRVSTVPVIFASARTSENDRVSGLDMGGDDYLPKPYSMRELLSRVNAVMRRAYGFDEQERVVTFGDVCVNLTARTVSKKGESISLSLREFDLLAYLCEHPNTALSKEKLLGEVWGAFSELEPSTLTVHIRWLREKLEDDPAAPQYIKTVYKVGYKLEIRKDNE